MTLKRFIRDFALLLGFCAAFYFLTVTMSRLDKKPPSTSDFSETRKRAGVSWTSQDWPAATASFLSLTKKDPYNGYAWYRFASSLDNQRKLAAKALQSALDDVKQVPQSSDTTNESGQLIDGLRAEFERLSSETKEAFNKVREFARFRGDALLHLAAIESLEGSYMASLEYLDLFVGNGNYTFRGLESYEVFGVGGPEWDAQPDDSLDFRLHAKPEFWEIVERESINRSR